MNEVVDEIYENETAEELYERIQREKERLISKGKLKKQKKLPEISEDEIPFEIPKSWKWVRLGEIGDYKKGPFGSALKKSLFVPKGNNTIKVYEQKNAIKKDITLGEYYISYDYFKSNMSSFEVQQNDILVSCAGTIGETYIIPSNFEKGIINQALMRIRLTSYIDKNYFLLVFDTLLRQLTIKDSKGSAIKNIPPFEKLKSYLFPFPPLSEQKRISELIDRLFAKLDEAKEKALSALNTFELRKAKILHLAIQGKLSKQLDEYETAEELYEKIQIEKEKLISEGKLKKQKKLPEIFEDEIPFEIPKSWKWLRLGELSDTKDNSFADGPFGSNLKKEHYINEPEVRIIQISNIGEEGWKNENVKYTSFIHAETIKRSMVSCGDIVITKMMPAGRAIQVPDIEKNYILSSDVIKFVPHPLINRKYLLYSINSNVFKNQIYDEVQGITRVRTSLMKIKSYLIPLPPLEEQKEIVKLLDNIFEKEEKAKKLIESTLNKIELVKKSILARAVRGEL
ncbi:MAG TPA: restriction endonuclease subunit S [Candidatus Dwaynia gallinarum]|nr:restriction endonuclease subunit S [Candidatus Dwaynia gallinarum]